MHYSEAVKKTGGDSVGGQLIVNVQGRNILVGRLHDGDLLLAEDTDEAREVLASIGHGSGARQDPASPPAERAGRRARRKTDEAQPETQAAVEPAEELAETHHEVIVADDVITEEAMGGD